MKNPKLKKDCWLVFLDSFQYRWTRLSFPIFSHHFLTVFDFSLRAEILDRVNTGLRPWLSEERILAV